MTEPSVSPGSLLPLGSYEKNVSYEDTKYLVDFTSFSLALDTFEAAKSFQTKPFLFIGNGISVFVYFKYSILKF